MTYIINTTAIILFINGRSIRVEKTDIRYPSIIAVFDLPKEEQEDAVEAIMAPAVSAIKKIKGAEGFEIIEGVVYYKDQKLPAALSKKVASIITDGLPIHHFEKFWELLQQNPSSSSVNELMDFLEYKELPITEDGHFLAYKGVENDFWSRSGNPDTVVLQGTVDKSGRILNTIGETIEVQRRDVDDDRRKHCSHGLHVGSLDYASDFAYKLIVVKVNPADVVSVPTDYSCQKARVSKYVVLSEYVDEIKASVTDAAGIPLAESKTQQAEDLREEHSDFTKRVDNYLDRKKDEGYDEVTIRQIQNSFSPEYPSRQRVYDALQTLGYGWEEEDGVVIVPLF